MIDMHCHILPGIDDGAEKLETSIEMLKTAERDGIKTIIATPHYCRGRFENNLEDIKNEVKNLNNITEENKIDIEVLAGQEIFLDSYSTKLFKSGIIGTLNESRYMLVELPFDHLPENAMDIIYELRLLGVIPVLAHPERYQFIINTPSLINDFIEEGCFFQITSHSITGLYGKEVKRTAELMIKHNICDFIASDAHSNIKRTPEIKKSFDIIKGINTELVNKLSNYASQVLKNEVIIRNTEKIKGKKSIFEIFKKSIKI